VLTEDVADGADAFGEADVGQLGRGDAVADRPHPVGTRPAQLVDGDESAVVEVDSGAVVDQRVGVGPAADRDDDQIGLDRLAVAEADGGGTRTVRLVAGDLHPGAHVDLLLLERPQHLLGDVLVQAGQDFGQRFENGHVCAHVGQGRGELAADGTAADDDGTTGQIGQLQELVGGAHDRTVGLEAGNGAWHGPGGQDDGVARRVRVPPSDSSTVTEWSDSRRPVPATVSILRCLISPDSPLCS
jgi:hypothetical protein